MTITDIVKIENELCLTLPAELVECYMSNLLDGINNFPLIANLFFLKPESIIRINKGLRASGLWGKDFPAHLMIIGQEAEGYYAIDLRETPLRVYRFMDNDEWAFNPDDLDGNLTCSIIGKQGLSTYIESYPLSFLRSHREEEQRKKQGLPEVEMTSNEVYDWLNSLSRRDV
jgi:hypothetical protein